MVFFASSLDGSSVVDKHRVILCNGTGTTDRALRTSRLRRAPQFAMCFFPASELGCDALHDQPGRSLLSPALQRGRLRLRGSTRLPNVIQRVSGREATESGFSDSRTPALVEQRNRT